MYDHHAHVTWQQHDRRLAAAAERRRSNLEAVERARATTESHDAPHGDADVVAPAIRTSTLLATARAALRLGRRTHERPLIP